MSVFHLTPVWLMNLEVVSKFCLLEPYANTSYAKYYEG